MLFINIQLEQFKKFFEQDEVMNTKLWKEKKILYIFSLFFYFYQFLVIKKNPLVENNWTFDNWLVRRAFENQLVLICENQHLENCSNFFPKVWYPNRFSFMDNIF
jgi:hypothetical protein